MRNTAVLNLVRVITFEYDTYICYIACPETFAGYTDATNRMLAILKPPNARHPGHLTTPAWKAPAAAARL